MSAPLPHIPWGTLLKLEPADWYVKPGVPAEHGIGLRVVSVERVTDDVARVDGHGFDCNWASVACKEPWCQEVLVSVDALRRLTA